jgi:hypothetical protein
VTLGYAADDVKIPERKPAGKVNYVR